MDNKHNYFSYLDNLESLLDLSQKVALQVKVLPSMVSTLEGLSNRVKEFQDTAPFLARAAEQLSIETQLAIKEIAESMRQALPYLPMEQQKECKSDILPQLEVHNKKLSAKEIFDLINFLLALLSFIIAAIPNPQEAKIIEQQSQLITIEEERLELERQNFTELENIANNLSNAIGSLIEQVEAQTEQSNVFGEQVDGVDQVDITHGENNNTNGQD